MAHGEGEQAGLLDRQKPLHIAVNLSHATDAQARAVKAVATRADTAVKIRAVRPTQGGGCGGG